MQREVRMLRLHSAWRGLRQVRRHAVLAQGGTRALDAGRGDRGWRGALGSAAEEAGKEDEPRRVAAACAASAERFCSCTRCRKFPIGRSREGRHKSDLSCRAPRASLLSALFLLSNE
ncbi:hypothetical protein HZB93_02745 [Candidatus Falkowbacteria bacterium]|nr:hypothetical protein [Candidatus Falkowbacteria bacterium]